MSRRWLSVVGIGEDGLDGLNDAARACVDAAELYIGGKRHLAMLATERPRFTWRTPLLDTVADIRANRGRRVCVLATGDPMFFGVGVTLARHFPLSEMTIHPAPSAFSLACARLGWPLAEVETLTLHGRPLDTLNAHLYPGARLLLLSEDGTTPAKVARRLRERGFGPSRLTVFEHMGGGAEARRRGTTARWTHGRVADLNTVAVECRASAGAVAWSRAPGLPDDAFAHDGQLTKREVRAATIAALAPFPGQRLWDVGAGCGSIAIEWMRAGGVAVAVERDRKRLRLIERNARALGTPTLTIVAGEAPGALNGLQTPDAVFIGGGLSEPRLLRVAWRALPRGGRLVANAVTVEGEAALQRWHAQVGGEMSRIAVSRTDPVGGFTGWRPLMPVTQIAAVKP